MKQDDRQSTGKPARGKKGITRRAACKAGVGLALSAPFMLRAETPRAEAAVEVAHDELWRRLIDRHQVMLDFTDEQGNVEIPTPDECRLGKPFAVRGQFAKISWESSARQLFVLKWMHRLTGDQTWDRMYRQSLQETEGLDPRTRLAVCERGMIFEHQRRHSWTASIPNACLRALWEMETDLTIKTAYAQGLQAPGRTWPWRACRSARRLITRTTRNLSRTGG